MVSFKSSLIKKKKKKPWDFEHKAFRWITFQPPSPSRIQKTSHLNIFKPLCVCVCACMVLKKTILCYCGWTKENQSVESSLKKLLYIKPQKKIKKWRCLYLDYFLNLALVILLQRSCWVRIRFTKCIYSA